VWPGEIPPGWELEWVEVDYWKHHGWPAVVSSLLLVYFRCFWKLWTISSWQKLWFVIIKPFGVRIRILNCCISGLAFKWALMHIFDPCCFSSDLPGVNTATYDMMVLYYCLNDQSGSVLGDSTVFSWAGCHSSTHDSPIYNEACQPIWLVDWQWKILGIS
jgi:hypothetical protein